MLYVHRFSLYISVLAILSACGSKPGFQSLPPEDSGFNGNLNTQTRNAEGKLYTGFSPASAFLAMQEKIEPTPENQKLAENIQGVQSEVRDKNLSVKINWTGLEKPLEFSGPLKNEDGKVSIGGMKDLSNQKTDIKVSAACEKEDCEVLNAFLQNDKGNKIAFIVRNEKRILRVKIPDSQKKNIEMLSQEKLALIKKSEQGTSVKVTSTEIFPGKSTFEISMEGANGSLIKGDLVTTNEGGSKIEAKGDFSKLGTGEMVGNNNEGELIFRFSQDLPAVDAGITAQVVSTGAVKASKSGTQGVDLSSSKKGSAVSYVVLEGRTQAQAKKAVAAPVAPQKLAHPLLSQIMADKDRAELKTYFAKKVITKTKDSKGNSIVKYGAFYPSIKKYVACHQGDSKGCGIDKHGTDRSKNVKKMVDILGRQGLPAAMTMVSMVESEFNADARSKVGAVGWWQFMPETARGYGLKVNLKQGIDERKNLEKATTAAARMLKELLVSWKGDLKMSLASYNYGEERLRILCRKRTDSKNCRAGSDKVKFAEMNDLLEVANKDFWKFYRSNFLPKETQNYVLKFLSGNLVALSPQDYGFSSQPVTLD